MKTKRIYCDWCGEDLGESVVTSCYRDPESCGKPECDRAIRDMERQAYEEAADDARDDDYSRYR